MKALDEINARAGLKWADACKLESRLLTGDNEIVATLAWKNRWGSQATGEASDGKWNLKRAGFIHAKITISQAESSTNIGELSMTSGKQGVLTLSDGLIYYFTWVKEGLTLADARREKILLLRSGNRNETFIQIEQFIDSKKPLSLLTILSWYVGLISYYENDTSFMGAMTAIM